MILQHLAGFAVERISQRTAATVSQRGHAGLGRGGAIAAVQIAGRLAREGCDGRGRTMAAGCHGVTRSRLPIVAPAPFMLLDCLVKYNPSTIGGILPGDGPTAESVPQLNIGIQ